MAVHARSSRRRGLIKLSGVALSAFVLFAFRSSIGVANLPNANLPNAKLPNANLQRGYRANLSHSTTLLDGQAVGFRPWSRQLLNDEAECREVHELGGVARCLFVEEAADCASEGIFDYNRFVYCDFGDLLPLGMALLVVWWLFCFVGLAVCADDFFCPSLEVISKTLRLSSNVAGVTFLAFGNGAPDLFSAISSLANIEDGEAGLAIGGLFGAGVFVTTCVVGAIAIVKPFKAMERPFLRDISFYLVAVYLAFFVLWKGAMRLAEAIGFICLYGLYVVVVVLSGNVYKNQRDGAKLTEEDRMEKHIRTKAQLADFSDDISKSISFSTMRMFDVDDQSTQLREYKDPLAISRQESQASIEIGQLEFPVPTGVSNFAFEDGVTVNPSGTQIAEDEIPEAAAPKNTEGSEELENTSFFVEFVYAINPINVEEWSDMKFYVKFYEIFKSPLTVAINLTCPVVSYDDQEKHNWCKPLNVFHCFVCPPFILFLIGVGAIEIGGALPVSGLAAIVGLVLAVVVSLTSSRDRKPVYHWAFGYAGFFCSMAWIYILADEIVSLLRTFGVVFNISNAILGLTLLAWGNSIGDLIANTVMARQGSPRMGFSACYGAPFFNLTLGLGIPLLINMFKNSETTVQIDMSGVQLILAIFLGGGLVISIIILPILYKFFLRRQFGFFLIAYYLAFIVTAILCESGLILSDWSPARSNKFS